MTREKLHPCLKLLPAIHEGVPSFESLSSYWCTCILVCITHISLIDALVSLCVLRISLLLMHLYPCVCYVLRYISLIDALVSLCVLHISLLLMHLYPCVYYIYLSYWCTCILVYVLRTYISLIDALASLCIAYISLIERSMCIIHFSVNSYAVSIATPNYAPPFHFWRVFPVQGAIVTLYARTYVCIVCGCVRLKG